MILDDGRTLPSTPRVAVIVLNYQHSEDTLRCMRSVAKSTYLNLVPMVVDNGSDESQLAILRSGLDPTIAFIENGENLGYAAGNNVAIRQALLNKAAFIWILNPDTTVEPDALEWMVRTASMNENCGIVGSRVLHGGSKPLKIWYDGATVDLDAGGTVEHQNMGALDSDTPARAPFATGYVTGTSMLVRAEVFEEVGLLPEEYFLYFEETDFNLRVQQGGWATIVEPRSRIQHFKRSTGRLPTAEYIYYYVRNRLVFGQRFTKTPIDDMVADLDYFLSEWRDRVKKRAPDWLSDYDELVAMALRDGRAQETGPRDLQALRSPR